MVELTWRGGERGEVSSEAREEEDGIRGGGGVAGKKVGKRGVGRAAIEWRHQPRHRPARPRLRPHLRAAPGRWARGACCWRFRWLVSPVATPPPPSSCFRLVRVSDQGPSTGWLAAPAGGRRVGPTADYDGCWVYGSGSLFIAVSFPPPLLLRTCGCVHLLRSSAVGVC